MLHKSDAEQIIITRGWLSQLPEEFRQLVVARSSLEVFQAKQPIYHAGDPPGGMYGIVAGGIAISVAPGEYGPYFAHFARPGFWFGEAAVITGQPRRIGVVARRKTMLLHLSLPAMREMLAADPGIWRFLAINAVISLDLAITGYDDLMIKDPEARLTAVLLRLAGYGSSLAKAREQIEIDATQAELAELAGLSRNGVGGILARLSDAGLIAAGYSQIRIVNPKALAQMIEETR